MKLAYIHSAMGDGFAVSTDAKRWALLADVATGVSDTAEALTVVARLSPSEVVELAKLDADISFACPVVRPSKVIGVGYNYAAHAAETGAAAPIAPVLFGKFSNALTGPFEPVTIDDAWSSMVDYEVELAVILGADAAGAASNPDGAVFGYAVANDVSARDIQQRDVQVSRAKGFDTFCPLGPWIVSRDEVNDPDDLRICSWVNGEKRQDATTAHMLFGVSELVSYIATGTTLEPGDVILTGSPPGVGHALNPPQYLKHGDVVACEIAQVGRIENAVRDRQRATLGARVEAKAT